MIDWKHQAALVTGASRGLGRELIQQLAHAGARVVGVARDIEPLTRIVQQLRSAGADAHALSADVADKSAAHRIAGAAAALVGPIDLLIHNASTLGPTPLRLLLDTDCESLEAVLQTNLVGPFRLSKLVAGSMALRGRGSLVHISSDAAVAAYPTWGAYSISKAAQDHLSRILAAELRDSGIRVLSIDPGEMDTQMHRAAVPDADPTTLAKPQQVAARILQVLQRGPELSSGSRIEVARWEAA